MEMRNVVEQPNELQVGSSAAVKLLNQFRLGQPRIHNDNLQLLRAREG
jgi:hypothetical protein